MQWPQDTREVIRNRHSKKGQTIQWPKDTREVIRSRHSKKGQTIQWPKDTRGVIRSRHSKKGQILQWSKEQAVIYSNNNKKQHKAKDLTTRTPLKTGDELMCSGRIRNSFFTCGTRRVQVFLYHNTSKTRCSLIGLFKCCVNFCHQFASLFYMHSINL